MTRRRKPTAAAAAAEAEAGEARRRAILRAAAAAGNPRAAALLGVASPPASASPVDVEAAVAAALARRDAEQAEAVEAARYAAAICPTGACCRCGLETCLVVDLDGGKSPGWYTDGAGHHCQICEVEHAELPVTATPGEAKEVTARRLLGVPHLALRVIGDPSAFERLRLWWHEHPEAAPVTTIAERFAHVDLERLRAEYQAIAEPTADAEPVTVDPPRSDPCPRCGAGSPWVRVPIPGEVWHCRHCDHHADSPDPQPVSTLPDHHRQNRQLRNDVDEFVATLLGIDPTEPTVGDDPIVGLAKRVGFRWAHEARGGRRRRSAPARPWAYLDLDRMRRRAGLDDAAVG